MIPRLKSLCACLMLACLSLTTTAQAQDIQNTSVRGTILAFIPMRAGIVVASDSRETLAIGSHCDNRDKIFPLKNHSRSLFGMSGSYGPKIGKMTLAIEDPCAFLKSANASVDFREVSKTFLESWKGSFTKATVQKLESVLQQKIEELLPTYPELVGADQGILSFVLVQYVKSQKATTYASFQMLIRFTTASFTSPTADVSVCTAKKLISARSSQDRPWGSKKSKKVFGWSAL